MRVQGREEVMKCLPGFSLRICDCCLEWIVTCIRCLADVGKVHENVAYFCFKNIETLGDRGNLVVG